MDTRTKILTLDAAQQAARRCHQQGTSVTLVAGYFDPLLADHARRLEEIARPGAALFISILDPPEPLLPAQARAELAAGLRVVDYVILGGKIEADAVFHEEAADGRRIQELIEHVHRRQE